MANITSSISKLNDLEISSDSPITENLMNKVGANINALIDGAGSLKVSPFIASGTFTAPARVTKALLIGCGGGAGGTDPYGGGGAPLGILPVTLSPGSTYTVTVGAGGTGGVAGGTTSFDTLNFYGGVPIAGIPRVGATLGGASTIDGQGNATYNGGAGGTSGSYAGGGGGAGPFGNGGKGNDAVSGAGSGAANSGAGGGGAMTPYPLGSGGSGVLYVIYMSV